MRSVHKVGRHTSARWVRSFFIDFRLLIIGAEESISLQHLHLWRPTKILPERMELIYDAEILLSINCTNYVPDISSATFEYLSERMKLSKRKCSGIRGESPSRCLFEVFRGAVGDMIKHKSWDLASVSGLNWCTENDPNEVPVRSTNRHSLV